MGNISWVDFSKTDRDLVYTLLSQLNQQVAVDELGVGAIRDAFSNFFFPGTSTIHTLAKYFFIIPYICIKLEKEQFRKKPSAREFIKLLEKEEIGLIKELSKQGEEGVIGARKEKEGKAHELKRKPSSIYWNALKTYGIFRKDGLTLFEYATQLCKTWNDAAYRDFGDSDSNELFESSDDQNSNTQFWLAPKHDGRLKNLSKKLEKIEADFLRQRIISAEGSRDSLLALILRENNEKAFVDMESVEASNELDDSYASNFRRLEYVLIKFESIMPSSMRDTFRLACDFSKFIFGAQIRYNVVFSRNENLDAKRLWKDYLDYTKTENWRAIDLDKLYMFRLVRGCYTDIFLREFKRLVNDEQSLDKLIISHEKNLKGEMRAKLSNVEVYPYSGTTINMQPLTYRLHNACRLVKEIFSARETTR